MAAWIGWGAQRGTGASPALDFVTPFLARKGDGGMVEGPVEHRRHPESGRGCRCGSLGDDDPGRPQQPIVNEIALLNYG